MVELEINLIYMKYFSICVLHGYFFSWNHLSHKNQVNKVMRENGKHDILGKNLAIQFC